MKKYRSHNNKILQALFLGEPVYIKNTGVQVELDYMGKDIHRFRETQNERNVFEVVKVNFITVPNIKALKLLEYFDVLKNSVSNQVTGSGLVKLNNLSLQPYEGETAKILFKK